MLTIRKIRKICTTCHGNGYIRVAHRLILEIIVKSFNVQHVHQREKQMKTVMLCMILLLLIGCSQIKFDRFDPTTATVRWIIKNGD